MKIIISLCISFIYILATQVGADKEHSKLLLEQKEEFAQNNFIQKVKQTDDLSSAYVVLKVNKNIDKVYEEINDINSYYKKIDSLSSSNIYEKSHNGMKATLVFSKFFLNLSNSFVYVLDKNKHIITWTLDKDKPLEMLTYSAGMWKLEKIDNQNTMVYYQNTMSLFSWLPSILVNYILNQGAKDATYWLL